MHMQVAKGRARGVMMQGVVGGIIPSRPSWTSLLIATLAFSMVHTATDSPLHSQHLTVTILT